MSAYRHMTGLVGVLLSAASVACSDSDNGANPPPPATAYEAVEAFAGLTFARPVDLQDAGDPAGRLFVVEQAGRILVFQNTASASTSEVFLDIRSQVNDAGNEEGLLGLAFHPDFANNRHYFVCYTLLVSGERKNRVSRFTALSTNPDTTLAITESEVITIDDEFSNHNGGQIAFGPDGHLYIGTGDGGSANDPNNSGQDRTALLGKMLRINVDTLPYTIPSDNPFVGNQQGYREEIYAYGLRNPWRFSFDRVTGRLWCGDVGQDTWEEIDLIENGKNYGWKIMEGNVCRPPTTGCSTAGLELPVWVYAHDGGRSITGGYVFRGSRLAGLVGAYIYADFVTGEIWALRYSGPGTQSNSLVQDTNLGIASFGVDRSNELYICAFDGKIYQLSEK